MERWRKKQANDKNYRTIRAGHWDREVSIFVQYSVMPFAGGSRDQPQRFWSEVAAYQEAKYGNDEKKDTAYHAAKARRLLESF